MTTIVEGGVGYEYYYYPYLQGPIVSDDVFSARIYQMDRKYPDIYQSENFSLHLDDIMEIRFLFILFLPLLSLFDLTFHPNKEYYYTTTPTLETGKKGDAHTLRWSRLPRPHDNNNNNKNHHHDHHSTRLSQLAEGKNGFGC